MTIRLLQDCKFSFQYGGETKTHVIASGNLVNVSAAEEATLVASGQADNNAAAISRAIAEGKSILDPKTEFIRANGFDRDHQPGIKRDGSRLFVVGDDGIKSRVNSDVVATYQYSTRGDGLDESVAVNALLTAAGENATIKFNKDKPITIRGRINLLPGQELIDLNIKRANQITTTLASTCTAGAYSAALTDASVFRVGDQITFGNAASPGIPTIWEPGHIITRINGNTVYWTDGPFSPLNNSLAAQANMAGGTIVATGGPLIYFRRGSAAWVDSTTKRVSLIRPIVDGNKDNNLANRHWYYWSDISIVATDGEIYKPIITNSAGEGILWGGDRGIITIPNINSLIGNGIHLTDDPSGGCYDAQIIGGDIEDTNDAPVKTGTLAALGFSINSTAVTGLPDSATKSYAGAALVLASTGTTVGFLMTHSGTTGTLNTNFTGTTGSYDVTIVASLAIESCKSPGSNLYGTGATNSSNRFANRVDIGHRNGGITFSRNIHRTLIKGVNVTNCFAGIGGIGSIDKTDNVIDGCCLTACGTPYDSTMFCGTGGIEISNATGSNSGPTGTIIRNTSIIDCYTTIFGNGMLATHANACDVTIENVNVIGGNLRLLDTKVNASTLKIDKGSLVLGPTVTGTIADFTSNKAAWNSIACYPTNDGDCAVTITGFTSKSAKNGLLGGYATAIKKLGLELKNGTILAEAAGAYDGDNVNTGWIGINFGQYFAPKITGPVLIDAYTAIDACIKASPGGAYDYGNLTVDFVTAKRRSTGSSITIGANASNLIFNEATVYPDVASSGTNIVFNHKTVLAAP